MQNSFNKILTLGSVFTSLASLPLMAQDTALSASEQQQVISVVKEVANAFEKGNHAVTISRMPARFFKLFKTNQKTMLKVATQAMNKMNKLGFKLQSYSHGKPSRSYQCKLSKIVFVPVTMKTSNKKSTIVSEGFLIVSKDAKSSRWEVVDGAGARNRKNLDKLYGCKKVKLKLPRYKVKQI